MSSSAAQTKTAAGMHASGRPAAAYPEEGWDMSPRLRGRILGEAPVAPRPPIEPGRPLPTARGILTAAEIEMLLRPDLSDMDEVPNAGLTLDPIPERTEKDGRQEAARRIGARLTRAFRDNGGLPAAFSLQSLSPVRPAEAITSRQEPGQAIICFSLGDDEIVAVMVLGASLCQTMIEAACGGRPAPVQTGPLSPIDMALIEGLTRPVAPALVGGACFACVETDPLYVASLLVADAGHEIVYTVRAGGREWSARVILAASVFGEVVCASQPAKPATAVRTGLVALMTARIASVQLPLSRLSGLRPGATLMLGVPSDQPVELLSGGADGELAAEAQIGRKGNRIALRISRHGPAIRALSGAVCE